MHHRWLALVSLLSPSCVTYRLPDAPIPDPVAVYRAELSFDVAVRAVKECMAEFGLVLVDAASGAGTYVGQQSIAMGKNKADYSDYCDFGQIDFRPRNVELIRRAVRVTVEAEPVGMASIRVVVRYVGTVNDSGMPEQLERLRTIAGSSTGAFERSFLKALAANCKDQSPDISVTGGAKPWQPRETPRATFAPADPK